MDEIKISIYQWLSLIKGLKLRTQGVRESGAFLLSELNSRKVNKVMFYDTFDPSVSESGIIQFKGAVEFYKYLAEKKLEVLADIHTHPGSDTRQSESDQSHPMIRLTGHIAIIAPNFCKSIYLRPTDCSVYKYLGEFNWQKFSKKDNPIKLKFV